MREEKIPFFGRFEYIEEPITQEEQELLNEELLEILNTHKLPIWKTRSIRGVYVSFKKLSEFSFITRVFIIIFNIVMLRHKFTKEEFMKLLSLCEFYSFVRLYKEGNYNFGPKFLHCKFRKQFVFLPEEYFYVVDYFFGKTKTFKQICKNKFNREMYDTLKQKYIQVSFDAKFIKNFNIKYYLPTLNKHDAFKMVDDLKRKFYENDPSEIFEDDDVVDESKLISFKRINTMIALDKMKELYEEKLSKCAICLQIKRYKEFIVYGKCSHQICKFCFNSLSKKHICSICKQTNEIYYVLLKVDGTYRYFVKSLCNFKPPVGYTLYITDDKCECVFEDISAIITMATIQ